MTVERKRRAHVKAKAESCAVPVILFKDFLTICSHWTKVAKTTQILILRLLYETIDLPDILHKTYIWIVREWDPRIGMETRRTSVTQYPKLHRAFLPLLVDEAVHSLKTL